MTELSARQKFLIRVTKKLPYVLLREPERVFINVAVVIIGVQVLIRLSTPSSLLRAEFPIWLILEWALTLCIGGACTLTGMVRSTRANLRADVPSALRARLLERFGLGCTATGALIYGCALWSLGFQGLPAGTLFVFLSISKTIRLFVSSSGKAIIDERSGL